MGANASLPSGSDDGPNSPSEPRLGDLPESCIALVLSHLDPPEICKLARLNRAFRAASAADFVWQPKLPSNYKHIIEKLLHGEGVVTLGKKDVYARLCTPISFDGGTKGDGNDRR
ncbi:hypothetical protein RJ639_031651 [Escallonia herrerae]|uniref:F-box domain-containing protein n=1 Tax=Escallonia herrerae TaxID=1293975 RepID=A0AA88X1D6_9ASTE|nr:hypothetical protein RJ639_031651 [Escallonia herrerae]